MPTYIRLTDYKSSDEKEQEFFNPENRYKAKQEDFSKIPGSPIAYWVSDKIKNIFANNEKIGDIAEAIQGMITGNNDILLRLWCEVNKNTMGLNFKNVSEINIENNYWIPYNKGGENRKWYGNHEYLVNWQNNGNDLTRNRSKNKHLWLQEGVNWGYISSSFFSAKYFDYGYFFDVSSSSAFPDKNNIQYITSFLNTKLSSLFLKIIAPTINFQVEDIQSLPIVFPKNLEIKQKIDQLTQECINISKEEWDSRETSWDFRINELIRMKNELVTPALAGKKEDIPTKVGVTKNNVTLKDAYDAYCKYWEEKFFALHKNEEELNRLFIEIYGLEDELTPEVELKDITILKNEAKIVSVTPTSVGNNKNGVTVGVTQKLEFQADEIIKQFISYGVGVMFGRYSLDSDGLLIANMGQDMPTSASFEIDEDNIIPVLEDEYFSDDIVSRFVQFVKVVFGDEHLQENVAFIEKSLGVSLRKYFVKGFYEDHIKRYKKRPIYWMVSSPKKGFMSLFYMHRYQSDIFAKIQNDYLREYITKLESSKELAQREADDINNSTTQRKKATKTVANINKKLEEIIKFDREVLTSFAQDRVEIDLDDGVKVNYCRFREILFPITGLCK